MRQGTKNCGSKQEYINLKVAKIKLTLTFLVDSYVTEIRETYIFSCATVIDCTSCFIDVHITTDGSCYFSYGSCYFCCSAVLQHAGLSIGSIIHSPVNGYRLTSYLSIHLNFDCTGQ